MRILVCGGRDYTDKIYLYWVLGAFLEKYGTDLVIIQGEASGADRLAKGWAKEHHIPFESYPADWSLHGKNAGYLRNQRMLHEGKPDLVIPFPGGKGTAMMVQLARKAGVEVLKFEGGSIKHRS